MTKQAELLDKQNNDIFVYDKVQKFRWSPPDEDNIWTNMFRVGNITLPFWSAIEHQATF